MIVGDDRGWRSDHPLTPLILMGLATLATVKAGWLLRWVPAREATQVALIAIAVCAVLLLLLAVNAAAAPSAHYGGAVLLVAGWAAAGLCTAYPHTAATAIALGVAGGVAAAGFVAAGRGWRTLRSAAGQIAIGVQLMAVSLACALPSLERVAGALSLGVAVSFLIGGATLQLRAAKR